MSETAKVYKSKIGIGILLFIIFIVGGASAILIIKNVYIALLVLIPVIALLLNIFLQTSYTITTNKRLLIKSGILFKAEIDIETIRKIESSNSILSSPALSMDRLEIFYNKYDTVLVSPKDKQEFIAHLLTINPNISVIVNRK